MGFFKLIFCVTIPIVGSTVIAFRLGRRLPTASRQLGNSIALGYIYFKCLLKYLKPKDHISFEMLDLARKSSQQAMALKREMRNTMKKMKDDAKERKDEMIKEIGDEIDNKQGADAVNKALNEFIKQNETQLQSSMKQMNGSILVWQIIKNRADLQRIREEKMKSKQFFTKV